MVNDLKVFEKLCSRDERNPYHIKDEDCKQIPRDNCYCDNCFYGRDEMALEILRLKKLISEKK